MAGQDLVVFTNMESATGFLEHRGHICDGRPRFIGEFLAWASVYDVANRNLLVMVLVASELLGGGLILPGMNPHEQYGVRTLHYGRGRTKPLMQVSKNAACESGGTYQDAGHRILPNTDETKHYTSRRASAETVHVARSVLQVSGSRET